MLESLSLSLFSNTARMESHCSWPWHRNAFLTEMAGFWEFMKSFQLICFSLRFMRATHTHINKCWCLRVPDMPRAPRTQFVNSINFYFRHFNLLLKYEFWNLENICYDLKSRTAWNRAQTKTKWFTTKWISNFGQPCHMRWVCAEPKQLKHHFSRGYRTTLFHVMHIDCGAAVSTKDFFSWWKSICFFFPLHILCQSLRPSFFSIKFNAHLNVNHGWHDICFFFFFNWPNRWNRARHTFILVRTTDLTTTTKIILYAKPSNLIIWIGFLSDFA